MRKRPRLIVAAVLVGLVGALLQAVPVTPAAPAQAADAADFDPGYLISDELFYDGGAMTAAEVQAFIESKHSGCLAGYTCLDTYAQSTPTMAGTAYCDAMPGRDRETAASIIARVGAACDISQRYLLVLLQKEQSLVTLRNPAPIRYERATGFACPDTAPCNPAFGGFFYQVYNAARQFQRYKAHPENWAHRAGVRNWVWWHPNTACGSSAIFIRNAATAGLYNYTPYRPNAAALANLYGTGDACSAYGNRNTWRMWTDWFGSPTATPPTAKRLAGADRYATAVAVSRSEFAPGVPVVYLASGQNFPDGLAAGPAAAHQGGPVLLTPHASVPRAVLDEIVRLRPQRVVIVGDRSSVSASVESSVRALWGSGGRLGSATTDAGAATADPSSTDAPSADAPSVEVQPAPIDSPEPILTPEPSDSPAPTESPAPSEMPESTVTPDSSTAAPSSAMSDESATAESTATAAPEQSDDAAPSAADEAAQTPAADEPDASTQATPASAVLRLGGANRYETSRLIAEYAFPSATSAFVATGLRFPDALSAGPAAAQRNAPVLLVTNATGGLDAATRATMQRLGVRWVGIVGDNSSVSVAISQGLQATGAQAVRYAGSDRYGTSVRLASVFGSYRTAFIASGQNFPDALAGAAAAGSQRAPLLLTAQSCMPSDVRSSLFSAMPSEVLVLGGTPSVSAESARYVSC